MLKKLLPAALIACSSGAIAQAYPNKPVHVVVPYAAGGTVDTVARAYGIKLGELWGQPVVIDNRAGAGGNIGADVVAKSAPDGYNLLVTTTGHAVAASLYKKLPFDPIKDFAPIVLVATQPNILVVHPALPVKNVKDLIALAKAKPGQLNYANSGTGANAHLAAELFKSMTGTSIEAIAYKSAAPALVDLIRSEEHTSELQSH